VECLHGTRLSEASDLLPQKTEYDSGSKLTAKMIAS
jgi:hypothetical protein